MPFANIDTAFLKDEVGPILAKGMAETVIACPSDPVEYLALWLLHHLQMQELEEKKRVAVEQEELEKEAWTKVRQKKQGTAAETIQREWKHFVKVEDDRKHREKRLLEAVQDKERELEETDEFREENIQVEEVEGMTELERDKATEKARAAMLFKKAQAMLTQLDKAAIAEIKQMKKPSKNVIGVVKCCFYTFGASPKSLREWMQIRMAIKPALFLEKISAFEPVGPGKKKRLCTRVRRILKGCNDEEIRTESVAVFLLYQWCAALVEYREKHEEEVKLKKELGKEVEEEEEEEEDPETVDAADKDPDEEVQRLIEEEEKKKAAEEEARWKAEQGEGDGEEGDEDEG